MPSTKSLHILRPYYKDILKDNKENQAAVIHGYQTILDALAKRMEIESTTEEDRKAITEDMITVEDKIALADLQNKIS